ncbi:urease accessory protein [Scopulibacillus daqui]|uniref:Urease accessory protein UreE n=1 Tax=Scopulibacillus daqui TaxID=1469162 RepID=A0ABS2Q2I8_9BACL|nr:urease accessory protein UreE [Scopulibacillus daqui]MBM7646505.1 urease accessory protein [Scopulibacillus daqui]
MIIEKVVNHLDALTEEEKKQRRMETVYLPSDDLVKRIQRVTTNTGRSIGIRLREAKDLEAGDVLYMDHSSLIVVDVLPDDLLVICPDSIQQMGYIAHQLGNRHLPAQFEGSQMLVKYDYLIEKLLNQWRVPYRKEKRKVKKAFRHVGHSHD